MVPSITVRLASFASSDDGDAKVTVMRKTMVMILFSKVLDIILTDNAKRFRLETFKRLYKNF